MVCIFTNNLNMKFTSSEKNKNKYLKKQKFMFFLNNFRYSIVVFLSTCFGKSLIAIEQQVL